MIDPLLIRTGELAVHHCFQGLDFQMKFSEEYTYSHFSMIYWLCIHTVLVIVHNNKITGNTFLRSYKNILFGSCECARVRDAVDTDFL